VCHPSRIICAARNREARRLTANRPIYRTPNPVEPRVPVVDPVTPEEEPRELRTGAALWKHRLLVLLFVFTCAVFGVFLVILPWGPIWTNNRLLTVLPALRPVMDNGFARGICSGLGALDIWIGFWEAVHYHEGERS
jgi:hypothetical protein